MRLSEHLGAGREARVTRRKPRYDVWVLPKAGSTLVNVDVDVTSRQFVTSAQANEKDEDDDWSGRPACSAHLLRRSNVAGKTS